jgi:uncharacterized membrane protein YeaQ/YmgE (transglycosylase-associated protein family)
MLAKYSLFMINHRLFTNLFCTLFVCVLSTAFVIADSGQSLPTDAFDWSLVWNRQVFYTVALGAVSAYVASRILGGEGYGLLGNIVIGVIGGLIGKWLTQLTKISMLEGFFGTLVSSVGGALVLILLIEIIKYIQRANQSTAKTRTTRKK